MVIILPRLSLDPLWEEMESPRVFKPPSLLAGERFLELTDADVPARISDPQFFSFWRDVLEAPPDVLDIVQNVLLVSHPRSHEKDTRTSCR